jgi:hypothetical protein
MNLIQVEVVETCLLALAHTLVSRIQTEHITDLQP